MSKNCSSFLQKETFALKRRRMQHSGDLELQNLTCVLGVKTIIVHRKCIFRQNFSLCLENKCFVNLLNSLTFSGWISRTLLSLINLIRWDCLSVPMCHWYFLKISNLFICIEIIFSENSSAKCFCLMLSKTTWICSWRFN